MNRKMVKPRVAIATSSVATCQPQHPLQRPAVESDDRVEGVLRGAIKASLVLLRRVLQQLGAHHRSQRERNHGGGQDGHAQRDGKFTKQAAHDIAHEQQRDENGNQRDGQRDDGEANLRRAFERRPERRLAGFDVAGDVLDHHDRVVHHEAGRDRQGHQRQVVQAVAEQVHHAEGGDQRQRNGDAGNDGRGDVAQEQEHDHHHQRHRKHQLELHVAHGGANGGGPVGQDADLDRRGQRRRELRQQLLDAIDDRDDVRARLPLNIQDDRRNLVHPGGLADVLGIVDDAGNVGQFDGSAVPVRDDERRIIAAGEQLVVGADLVGLMRSVEVSLGLIDVGGDDGRAQILQIEAVRSPSPWDWLESARPASVRR